MTKERQFALRRGSHPGNIATVIYNRAARPVSDQARGIIAVGAGLHKRYRLNSFGGAIQVDCPAMAFSYYTSFLIADPVCEDLRHVCGVMEFERPLSSSVTDNQLVQIIARGMDVCKEDIQLMSWSAVH